DADLPERFWVIETSAQEMFTANRRKFGEVLIYSDVPMPRPLNTSLLIAARLPGMLLFNGPAGIVTEATALAGHTPLFSSPPLC
ncbi:MAG: hypothetical protein WCP45_17925, partial [Verrucomicrobiota bacterium]